LGGNCLTKKTPQEELYDMLLNQLKITESRSTALTDRAKDLISFTGIMDTILVAIIMYALDDAKMKALKALSFFHLIRLVMILGFTFYLVSTVLSLLAYRVTKYFPAPRIASVEFIEEVFNATAKPNKKNFARQMFKGIQAYNEINQKKFKYLFWGTVCLTIAIIFTALTGIILVLSMG
jgi:hypothetical protein